MAQDVGRAQNTKAALRLSGPCHPALRHKLPERPRGANWAQMGGRDSRSAPRGRAPAPRVTVTTPVAGMNALLPPSLRACGIRARAHTCLLGQQDGAGHSSRAASLSKVQQDHAAHGARGGSALPRGELPALPSEGYLQAGGE